MNGTLHMKKRATSVLAVVVLAVFAIPATASAAKPNGLVATTLGSQDPRDTASADSAAGLVPSRIGSPDPRDTASARTSDFSAPGIVAAKLGSPDPRGATSTGVPAEFLGPVRPDGAALRPVFNELAAQAASSRAQASSAMRSEQGSTDGGFSWRDAGVGGGATLLLLALVGLALAVTRQGRKLIRV